MFDSKIKTEDHEKTPLQNANNVEVATLSIKDENFIHLEANAEQPEINEQKNDNEENIPEPQVSSGGLKLPSKVPVEIATSFDMSKDEWTLGEVVDLKIREIPFLVNKLIPLHTLNVLAGQSERGKSTLYTQLSLAIIRGDDEFLGCKFNVTHKRVLVISTEDGPIALSFRLNKQLNNVTLNPELRDRITFITNQDILEERIEKHLEKNRVDLIVMDAFADVFTGGDINSSPVVRRYLNTYVKITQMYGCTVLFVHHVGKGRQGNKPEKDQLLGSTGIEGKMRNVLMLSIVNDQHQLSIAKGNYVNTEDKKIPLYLNFDNNTLTFSRADGPAKPKETEQCGIDSTGSSEAKGKPGRQKNMALVNKAIHLDKEGKSGVEIAKIIGMHKSTISKWIKEYKSGLVSE
jgi:archaellum biogenesis ATPase FlaH